MSLDRFIKDHRRKDGRGSWCYECLYASPSLQKAPRTVLVCIVCSDEIDSGRMDKRYCSDKCGRKLRNRKYGLKKYNMTIEQYESLLDSQNRSCAICGKKEETKNKLSMPLDHCHETGKVRGLLCHPCNLGIGSLRHNPELLRRAANYVETAEVVFDAIIDTDIRLDYSERKTQP